MKATHWVMVAVGALGAAAAWVAPQLPPPWQAVAQTLATLAQGTSVALGLTTPKAGAA